MLYLTELQLMRLTKKDLVKVILDIQERALTKQEVKDSYIIQDYTFKNGIADKVINVNNNIIRLYYNNNKEYLSYNFSCSIQQEDNWNKLSIFDKFRPVDYRAPNEIKEKDSLDYFKLLENKLKEIYGR